MNRFAFVPFLCYVYAHGNVNSGKAISLPLLTTLAPGCHPLTMKELAKREKLKLDNIFCWQVKQLWKMQKEIDIIQQQLLLMWWLPLALDLGWFLGQDFFRFPHLRCQSHFLNSSFWLTLHLSLPRFPFFKISNQILIVFILNKGLCPQVAFIKLSHNISAQFERKTSLFFTVINRASKNRVHGKLTYTVN